MRVLVMGTLPSETEVLETRLESAGHEIVRCHEPGHAPFPCAALQEGRMCPLEEKPVDVAVTAHGRPWPRPSPFEDGAVCAIRRHVPLVVAGSSVHPFGRWASSEVELDDDVVAACEAAARAPLPEHTEIASNAVREALLRSGVNGEPAGATVHHHRGRLRVVLEMPGVDRDVEARIAAMVVTALRTFDSVAGGIDLLRESDPSGGRQGTSDKEAKDKEEEERR